MRLKDHWPFLCPKFSTTEMARDDWDQPNGLLRIGNWTMQAREVNNQPMGDPPETDRKHRIEVILSRLKARARRQSGLVLPIQSERG